MKKIRFSIIFVMTLILVGINTVYYVTTKQTLKKNQNEKVRLIVNNVRSSIDSTRKAEDYFNLLLAQQLRQSSIAIQQSLPPKIDQVKNEQLVELSKKLGLEGITLFVQTKDDVVGVKSSSPEEIGLSTKDWANGKWYLMFKQLLEKHDVTLIPGFGEKLENFWSGPIDTSMSNPSTINKWGYYNDGTTDYLINPYIGDKLIKKYERTAGVNQTIEKLLKRNPFLVEIAVLNSNILKKGEKKHPHKNVVWFSDRLVVYGSYKYRSKDDKANVEKAVQSGKGIEVQTEANGKKLLKTYFPVSFKNGDNIEDQLVIVVSSDYQEIQNSLNQKTLHTLLISLLCFLGGFMVIYIFIQIINKKEKTIFNVQQMYTKHIESLFRTVKEYRHDFNHHLYTISGLAKMKLYDELQEYIQKLLNIQMEMNDIINVNIPAFSGLLQAKIAEASEKRIQFEHHFEKFELLHVDMMKVTNLVRVVGNILDNAFHAVQENEEGNRKVIITGRYHAGKIIISIYNNGAPIPKEHLSKIFTHGFTTKKDKGGSGIGLAVSKKIIEEYKGTITVSSDENWTTFTITLPVSPREIVSVVNATGGQTAS